MMYQKRLLFNERWYSSKFFTSVLTLLRWTGLILSLFGLLLCIFYVVYPSSRPKWLFAELYILFFITTGFIFYFMPRLNARYIAWLKKVGDNSCKRMARRLVAKARKQVPYLAEYMFKGDLVSYYRSKDEQWSQVWTRRLKGSAVMGEHVTLFFKKTTSLFPIMLILYDNNDALELVLKDVGIEYKILSN